MVHQLGAVIPMTYLLLSLNSQNRQGGSAESAKPHSRPHLAAAAWTHLSVFFKARGQRAGFLLLTGLAVLARRRWRWLHRPG